MKPRTKAQRRMQQIVDSFKPLTKTQIAHYQKRAFPTVFFESRNRFVCSDCGHTWLARDGYTINQTRCPHCHHKGNVTHQTKITNQFAYFVISQHIEDWQVLRFIYVQRNVRAEKIVYDHEDLGAIFINLQGKRYEFSLRHSMNSWCLDAWIFGSGIEYRDSNRLARLPISTMITKSIHPILRRNGYDGKLFSHYNTADLIKALLTKPQVESWWKIGHKGVVEDWLYRPYINDKELHLIALASRHHHIFATRDQWHDFLDYVRDLEFLAKDTSNPTILFPQNFQEEHQRIHRIAQARRDRLERERQRRQMIEERDRQFLQAQLEKEGNTWLVHYEQMFSSLLINRDGFTISPLITPDDFQAEADYMHHCIRSHYGRQGKLLLSISKDGQKLETAEISLYGDGNLVQCRGQHNQPSQHHDQIVSILNFYMRLFIAYNKGRFQKKQQRASIQPQSPSVQLAV